MSKRKKAIGKGLGALLSNIESEVNTPKTKNESVGNTVSAQGINEILLSNIEVNPYQPRTEFDQQHIDELSASIKLHGLIQPITVRKVSENKFQLISGERRFRASKQAGIKQLPAYVREADSDQVMLELAILENIQRQDLNAMEVAISYQRLIDECSLTHEQLSERLGKNRSTITNYLRLLKLPPVIQKVIKEKKISMGHARALAGIENDAVQLTVFNELITQELSVRKLESLIKSYTNSKKADSHKEESLSHEYKAVKDQLVSHLGTKVDIKVGKAGKGQIVINFGSTKDFNRILELIEE